MENQVLIVILKPELRPEECQRVIDDLRLDPKVQMVKTFERVVDDVIAYTPNVEEKGKCRHGGVFRGEKCRVCGEEVV